MICYYLRVQLDNKFVISNLFNQETNQQLFDQINFSPKVDHSKFMKALSKSMFVISPLQLQLYRHPL